MFAKFIVINLVSVVCLSLINFFGIKYVYGQMLDYDVWLITRLNFYFWIFAFCSLITAFLNSIYNTERDFVKPIILSSIPYLFSIIFCFAFQRWMGVAAICIGMLLGVLISLIASLIFLGKKLDIVLSFSKYHNREIHGYFRILPLISISTLCFSMYQTVDAFWAPQIGPSNLSYLGYCQRIIVAIGTLLIIGPSTVIVPRLTEKIANGQKMGFLHDVIFVIKIIIYFSSFIAAVGGVLSKEIIYLLFERGDFSSADTAMISSILPNMLFGMVFMLCGVMLFRALYTIEIKLKIVTISSLLAFVLYFSLSGLGAAHYGIYGISVAYIFTWIFITVLLFLHIFQGNYDKLKDQANLFFLIKQMLLLALTTLFSKMLRGFLLLNLKLVTVYEFSIVVLSNFILSFFVYYVMTRYFVKINEPLALLRSKSILSD